MDETIVSSVEKSEDTVSSVEKSEDTVSSVEKSKEIVEKTDEQLSEEYDEPETIMQYLKKGYPKGWESLFAENVSYLERMDRGLQGQNMKFYPKIKNLFKAYEVLPTREVDGIVRPFIKIVRPFIKIVIVGQDPYYTVYRGECTAMGMSFSVPDGHPISPSLKNIYKRMLETNVIKVEPKIGNLTPLAKQGVFFMNIGLTVPDQDQFYMKTGKKDPGGEHVKRWIGWASKTVEYVCKYNHGCVFMLWGGDAQKIISYITSSCIVLQCSHPSPRGYSKSNEPFSKMDHFRQANEILKKNNIGEVDWNVMIR